MIHLLSIEKTNLNTKLFFQLLLMTTSSSLSFQWPRLIFPPQCSVKVQLFLKSSTASHIILWTRFWPYMVFRPLQQPHLRRLRRSVSGAPLTPTGQTKEPTPRCVRFLQDTPHSQSVSNIEQIRRSNSHVESIVWWRLYNGWCVWEIVFHRGG